MEKSEVNFHHICVTCRRQFIDDYAAPKGESDAITRSMLENVCQRYGV